ncbi:MAG: hypothetical protein ABFD89_18460 [Bryobacteraceae bacterium]
MVDAWPATLPQCFIVGYSDGEGDGLIETAPDIGPPISRPRSTAVVRPLSGAMRMTRAQIAILSAFFRTTLLRGSLPFSFTDPTFGGTVLVKFPKGSQPSWQQTGPGMYRVNITLSVLP